MASPFDYDFECSTDTHLWGGRNWISRNPMSAANLMRLVNGEKPKYTLRQRLQFLKCKITGRHVMVLDRWVPKNNHNWLKEKDYEIHLGCRRCPHLITLDPKIYPEGL